ncbi:hypothetical protein R1sor_009206 [Riccia sorocarpa]|uniref:Uncharacterized protein n=1 Tax=Riccia sorocarpa TaxID=122646 RepID=A0ABD3H7U5_9MARC
MEQQPRSPEPRNPREIGDVFTFRGNFVRTPVTVTCNSVQSQLQKPEGVRTGGIKPYKRHEAFSLSLRVASEKLGNIELQAGQAGCSDDLGLEEGEFDPRAARRGTILGPAMESRRAVRSRGGFDVSDYDRGTEKFGKDELRVSRDERNVRFGLEEGKRVESKSEEREGLDRFDIDRVLVEELTPNRCVSFLSEWPSVEKAKPTRDNCSNPSVERIHVENFPIQDCVDILPTDSQSIEGPPSALPMSSGSGPSKVTEAKKRSDLQQAAKEAEDKAVDSSEGILAKVRNSLQDSSEALVFLLDLGLHFLTCS